MVPLCETRVVTNMWIMQHSPPCSFSWFHCIAHMHACSQAHIQMDTCTFMHFSHARIHTWEGGGTWQVFACHYMTRAFDWVIKQTCLMASIGTCTEQQTNINCNGFLSQKETFRDTTSLNMWSGEGDQVNMDMCRHHSLGLIAHRSLRMTNMTMIRSISLKLGSLCIQKNCFS